MLLTSVAELPATGALLICSFHGLSAGNNRLPSNVGTSLPSSSSTRGHQLRRRACAAPRPIRQARSQPMHFIASFPLTHSSGAWRPRNAGREDDREAGRQRFCWEFRLHFGGVPDDPRVSTGYQILKPRHAEQLIVYAERVGTEWPRRPWRCPQAKNARTAIRK